MRVVEMSDIKSKFAGHLLDDIQLDGGDYGNTYVGYNPDFYKF